MTSTVLRRRRAERKRSKRSAIHARDVGDIAEVDELGQVAELHAVLDAHVLVLVAEILEHLGEADRRDSRPRGTECGRHRAGTGHAGRSRRP
jgi:hypothetical protein